MNGTPPTAGNGGRNGSRGVVAGVIDLSQKILGTLPPAFLLLVLINAFFIGSVLWFLDSQAKQKTQLVSKLIDKCMEIALHADPPTH
jgi:hypothetical protein